MTGPQGNKKFWTTSDGRQIKISDIEDQHLMNILALLTRKGAETYGDGFMFALRQPAHRFDTPRGAQQDAWEMFFEPEEVLSGCYVPNRSLADLEALRSGWSKQVVEMVHPLGKELVAEWERRIEEKRKELQKKLPKGARKWNSKPELCAHCMGTGRRIK